MSVTAEGTPIPQNPPKKRWFYVLLDWLAPATHRRDDEPNKELKKLDFRVVVTLLAIPVLLTLLWYYGRPPYFNREIAEYFKGNPDVKLYSYYYLAASSVLYRMILPLVIITLVFRDSPSNYGFKLKGTGGLLRVYLVLLGLMIPILIAASYMPSFQKKYPLYHFAHQDLTHFLLYELSYFFVFLSGESFWRGFIIFSLKPKFGYYSLAIMAIPYCMIHFGKPVPETMGAIITAFVLGYLALRHGSFWLGVGIHFTIAFSMDLLALWQKGQLFPMFGG